MVRFKRKEFASIAQLGDEVDVARMQGEGILIELIKVLEFYDKGRNMKHWLLEEIVGRYFKEAIVAGYLITDCLVQFEDRNTQIISRHFVTNLNTVIPMGNKFIESVFNKFNPGKEQYRKYIKDYSTELSSMYLDIEFYKRVMKYLALSFSGQIDPRVIGFWDNSINRMQVNYDSEQRTNKDLSLASKIILECIVNIKGYEIDEIVRLKSLIN